MHELGIASDILDVAVAEASRHEAKKVTAIRLRVGVLRAIEPEHLRFLFGHLSHETAADGASLSIEEVPVEVECASCGISESRAFTYECPKCKAPVVSLKGGDVLEIVSLDIET